MNLETALSDLQSQDYFIWDDFLSSDEIVKVVADYQLFYDQGSFQRAVTGNAEVEKNNHHEVRNDIRSDESYWLDPLALTLTQSLFWDRLELLKEKINEHCLLGLWSFGGHYSRYPIDGFYQRHLDRFFHDDQRTVSMVLYLNQHWVKADGGELRLHFPKGLEKTLDIAPLGGRLVCFLSATLVHEVLVSRRIRLSFAGWWKKRATDFKVI